MWKWKSLVVAISVFVASTNAWDCPAGSEGSPFPPSCSDGKQCCTFSTGASVHSRCCDIGAAQEWCEVRSGDDITLGRCGMAILPGPSATITCHDSLSIVTTCKEIPNKFPHEVFATWQKILTIVFLLLAMMVIMYFVYRYGFRAQAKIVKEAKKVQAKIIPTKKSTKDVATEEHAVLSSYSTVPNFHLPSVGTEIQASYGSERPPTRPEKPLLMKYGSETPGIIVERPAPVYVPPDHAVPDYVTVIAPTSGSFQVDEHGHSHSLCHDEGEPVHVDIVTNNQMVEQNASPEVPAEQVHMVRTSTPEHTDVTIRNKDEDDDDITPVNATPMRTDGFETGETLQRFSQKFMEQDRNSSSTKKQARQ